MTSSTNNLALALSLLLTVATSKSSNDIAELLGKAGAKPPQPPH